MERFLALVIGIGMIAIIYITRQPPDIEEWLQAYNINYYDYPIVTACGEERDTNMAFTCGQKIYIGKPWYDQQPVGIQVFVMAHEQGHQTDVVYNDAFDDEQFADCYAGLQLGRLDFIDRITTKDLEVIHNQLESWGSNIHGTPDQRWGAVMFGYEQQNCDMYNEVI